MGFDSITRRGFLVGASAAAVSPVMGQSPSAAKSDNAAKQYAEKLFATKPAPALSFAVVRGGSVVCSEAIGLVDIELNVPATPAHSFPMGSVSKVITSDRRAQDKVVAAGAPTLIHASYGSHETDATAGPRLENQPG